MASSSSGCRSRSCSPPTTCCAVTPTTCSSRPGTGRSSRPMRFSSAATSRPSGCRTSSGTGSRTCAGTTTRPGPSTSATSWRRTSLAGLLWFFARARFRRYVASVALLAGMGFATFALFPAAPPWLASREGELDWTVRLIGPISGHIPFFSFSFEGLWERGSEYSNPVAAVPSLHAAYTLLVTLFLWRSARWLWAGRCWCSTRSRWRSRSSTPPSTTSSTSSSAGPTPWWRSGSSTASPTGSRREYRGRNGVILGVTTLSALCSGFASHSRRPVTVCAAVSMSRIEKTRTPIRSSSSSRRSRTGRSRPERAAALETQVAASSELADRLAEQQRAVELTRSAAAEVEAPASLRARIEAPRRARRTRTPRRLGLIGVGAAAVVAVAIGFSVLGSETSGERLHAALAPTDLVPGAGGEATLTKTDSGWEIELDATGLPRLEAGASTRRGSATPTACSSRSGRSTRARTSRCGRASRRRTSRR